MGKMSEDDLNAAQKALKEYLDPSFIVNDLSDNEECHDFQLISDVIELVSTVINEGSKFISTSALTALLMQSYYRGYLRARREANDAN